jgi:hypothetical protein
MAETILALAATAGAAASSAGTALAAYAPAAATIGTGLSAAGTIYGGIQQNRAAEFEAKQMKARGDEEFAAGQAEANKMRREKELAQSRVRAVAAASGGGAGDPSITNIMEGIEEQGTYNELVAMYQGRSSRNKMYASAGSRRAEGRSALTGSLFKAGSTIYSRS